MAGQTSVTEPAVAVPGQLAYPSYPGFRGTKVNGDTAAIPFGVGVVRDGDDETVDLPTATGEVTADFEGIVHWDKSYEYNADGVAVGDALTVVTKGFVWVSVEDAVTANDDVFCRFVAAGAEQLGAFRSDADGTDAVAVPGAKFRSSTTGAGLAIVELP